MIKVIAIFHPRDIYKALKMIPKEPVIWFYLGQDIRQREKIAEALGKENRYFIGSLLQEVAYELRQTFLDFVAKLGFSQKNFLHWWALSVSYKSPLSNDLFLFWCYINVFEQICYSAKERILLVFVEDQILYNFLWQKYRKSNFLFFSRKNIIPELARLVLRGILSRGYFILHCGKTLYLKKRFPIKSQLINNRIFIYSWIEDRFFRNGKFTNAYFGRLQEVLENNSFKFTYVTPLFLSLELKKKCSKYTNFAHLDCFLDFGCLLKTLFSIPRITIQKDFLLYKILLWREMAYEFSSPSFLINSLQHHAFKKFIMQACQNQNEVILIYPFENQSWEKMFCIAANKINANVKYIGYQHSTIPLLLLNFFLGKDESEIMPLPQIIVTNGEYTLNLLKNAGYGTTKIINGGAFRYEYLYKMERKLVKREKKTKTILVALVSSRTLTEEMLLALFNAFGNSTTQEIEFIIKSHPDVPLESLKVQLPSWPAHFQKTEEPISNLLSKVDLVIYSSSTVGLEALLGGIPIVKYYSEHIIELDPLDAFNDLKIKSCSENNMRDMVLSALNPEDYSLAQEFSADAGNLKRFFSPVNEDVWKEILSHE